MHTASAGQPPSPLRERLQAALGDAYTLERELGGGGMSRVFVAQDARLGRHVVFKVLHPDLAAGLSAERFEREIRLAARLQHPHIVPLHAAGAIDALPYYTMPFVQGESLRERLRREGALPLDDAMRLVREVADALAYAHGAGVVHRDLKPENVLLSEGHAMVADFGIAKALTAATAGGTAGIGPTSGTLTSVGLAVGTPAYMAPEQALGDPATDHRADLYALGIMAYELCAGATPFAGHTPQQLIAAHLTETPTPLAARRPDVPPALDALVNRLLAKRPGDRPATAGNVVHELERLLMATSLTGAPPASASRSLRRSLAPALGGGVLFLCLVGGVVAALRGREADRAGETPATRIAVLPFENLGERADDYFAEGLAEAVRGQLATVPTLAVIDGRSAAAYRHSAKSLRQIGSELRVAYVLQGTVQWAADARGVRRVQVRPALVRVRDATTAWAAPYTAGSTDVFEVQAVIAQQVAEALQATLGQGQHSRVGTATTRVPEAYDHYLRGLVIEQRARLDFVVGDLWSEAAAAYALAVRADPQFGVGWAKLAMTRLFDAYARGDLAAAAATRAALDSAQRFAPDAPETHAARAWYAAEVEHQFDVAAAELRAAVRVRPSDATLLFDLGNVLIYRSDALDEALSYVARSVELDPRRPPILASRLFSWAGRHRDALRYADLAIAIAPGEIRAYDNKAQALVSAGAGAAAARAVLDTAVTRFGAGTVLRFVVDQWPLDGTAVLGEPYASRLESLRLSDYPTPVTTSDSLAFYSTKGVYWHRLGQRVRAAAYCDSAMTIMAPLVPPPAQAATGEVPHAAMVSSAAIMLACAGRMEQAAPYETATLRVAQRTAGQLEAKFVAVALAEFYLLAGDHERAVTQLELAAAGDPPHGISTHDLRANAFWAPLRGQPRFERLLAGR